MTISGVAFGAVIARLREALGAGTEKEVAETLGLKPNAFYNRKRLNSIPFEEIVRLAEQRKIRTDWLFFGVGDAFRSGGRKADTLPNLEPELLGVILYELDRATALASGREPHSVEATARTGLIAGQIYNQCHLIQDPRKRRLAIRDEAEQWAAAAAALERIVAHDRRSAQERQPEARPARRVKR
jgi:hypothetical protein